MSPCDHDFQWDSRSDDFGVCSKCGHEAEHCAICGNPSAELDGEGSCPGCLEDEAA